MPRSGRIFDIQPFSLHDGPGTRTTVFLQGCNLCCNWCHNPESQMPCGALLFYPARCIACGACAAVCTHGAGGKSARHTDACVLCGACAEECFAEALKAAGREIAADQLFDLLIADRDVYERSGGGVTFSGGEPLLQAEFVQELVLRLLAEGVHTAVETALNAPWETVKTTLQDVDLVFADLKCVTDAKHRMGTGAGNARILQNIENLSAAGKNLVLRTPVVPGFNADEEEIGKIADFARCLPNRHLLEFMAYHGMCAPKYRALGREFPMEGTPEPTSDDLEKLARIARDCGMDVKISM